MTSGIAAVHLFGSQGPCFQQQLLRLVDGPKYLTELSFASKKFFAALREEALHASKEYKIYYPAITIANVDSLLDSKSAALDGPLLCIAQLLQFLHSGGHSNANTEVRHYFTGICTGMAAAAATAAASCNEEVIMLGSEAIRLLFWTHFYCSQESGSSEINESRAMVAFENHEQVEKLLKAFNSNHSMGHLSCGVVTSASCCTIFGDHQSLLAFKSQQLDVNGISSASTSIYAEYHGGTRMEGARSKTLKMMKARSKLDAARWNIRRDDTLLGIKAGTDIYKSLVDAILIDVCYVQDTVDQITRLSISKDSTLIKLYDYGPEETLSKRTLAKLSQRKIIKFQVSPVKDDENAIAVIGVGCKLPGAESPRQLWNLLLNGGNTIREVDLLLSWGILTFQVPPSRFDYHGLPSACRWGNFVDDIELFDNEYFKISAKEAKGMDPQQRLLYEVAEQALQDAGYMGNGDRVGCFIGVATGDYAENASSKVEAHFATGTLRAFLSGKLSYHYKWSGPSISYDTACSSSFTAIHNACRALIANECDAAVAGGVNAITSSYLSHGLAKGHFLSPTGQCKSFDADADGYCRSEGCTLFVLKRLQEAQENGDQIHGVILGSSLNHNARSHSITHPDTNAQGDLFQMACKSARVREEDISIIEAHGTGTKAGDVAELTSLINTFGRSRTEDNPLLIGSVKANVGHGEAVSGATSLLKTLFMLKHELCPPQISIQKMNPKIISLMPTNVKIPTVVTPLKSTKLPILALVNNFGASGSNSALVVRGPLPISRIDLSNIRSSHIIVVSARTRASLEGQCRLLKQYLEHERPRLEDLAFSTTARQVAKAKKVVIHCESYDQLLIQLDTPEELSFMQKDVSDVAFIFSGQGSQYTGMASVLYATHPYFREIVDKCNYLVQKICSMKTWTIGADSMERRQLDLFILEYALAKLWISWGIKPSVVLGHSIGEYAALCISGVIALGDALFLILIRARLMTKLCPIGQTGMLAIRSEESKVRQILAELDLHSLEIACYNDTRDLVVAGPLSLLDVLKVHVDGTYLPVPCAFHSQAVHDVAKELYTVAKTIAHSPPLLPLVSSTTADFVDEIRHLGDHLQQHCAGPVFFKQAAQRLLERKRVGSLILIEIGPHPVHVNKMQCMVAAGSIVLPTLRRGQDDWITVTSSVAECERHGLTIDWEAYHRPFECRKVELPPPIFERRPFWISKPKKLESVAIAQNTAASTIVESAHSSNGWVTRIECAVDPFLLLIQGHAVEGHHLCPASVFNELVYSGISLIAPSTEGIPVLRNICYTSGLVTNSASSFQLYLILHHHCAANAAKGLGDFQVQSKNQDDIIEHVRGEVHEVSLTDVGKELKRYDILSKSICSQTLFAETLSERSFYRLFSRVVHYSSDFKAVKNYSFTENAATARLQAVSWTDDSMLQNITLHDAFLQVAGFLANNHSSCGNEQCCIATSIEEIKVYIPNTCVTDGFEVFVTMIQSGLEYKCDVYIYHRDILVGVLFGVTFKRLLLRRLASALSPAPSISPAVVEEDILMPCSAASSFDSVTVARALNDTLQEILRVIIGLDSWIYDDDTLLDDLGLDSLMSIELSHQIELEWGLRLYDPIQKCAKVRDLKALIQSRSDPIATLQPSPCPSQQKLQEKSIAQRVDIILRQILDLGEHTTLLDDTSLDELGVDSLMSIEILDALQREAGRALTKDLIRTCKTVGCLRALFHSARLPYDLRNDGVTLIETGRKGTIFLFADGSGQCDYLHRLPRTGYTVYGLPNPGLGKESCFEGGVVELASYYCEMLSAVDFQGPYIVGGWSFGGIVAWEVAHQLSKRRTPPVGVLLIDSPTPQGHVPIPTEVLESIAAFVGVGSANRDLTEQFRCNSSALRTYDPPNPGLETPIILLRSEDDFKAGFLPDSADTEWLCRRSGSKKHSSLGWDIYLDREIVTLPIRGHHFNPFAASNIETTSAMIVRASSVLFGHGQ